jgi:hypothetical protein
VIVFIPDEREVFVARVVHGRRDLGAIGRDL